MLAEKITAAGFTLETDGHRLIVKPSGKLTDRQRDFIRRHRDQIIAELTAANDGGCLTMRRCDTCGTDTLHQRLEGQWCCTRRHPPWPRFDDSGRTGPVVECWTPAGGRILIRARYQAHAAWLRKMNPRPKEKA